MGQSRTKNELRAKIRQVQSDNRKLERKNAGLEAALRHDFGADAAKTIIELQSRLAAALRAGKGHK